MRNGYLFSEVDMRARSYFAKYAHRSTDRDKNLSKTVAKWRGYILSAMVRS